MDPVAPAVAKAAAWDCAAPVKRSSKWTVVIILNRMSLLKERLAEIDKQKRTQRQNRGKMVRVALVGYTNVGKSTLLNLLSKSEVFAENKLFATLDTTVRKVVVSNLPFLLADTVGFIRKLPTDLVESFKSTLDETREADLLVHVVDVSHPDFEEQIEVVDRTLCDLGCADKPQILIFNKMDAYTFTPKDPNDLTPAGNGKHSVAGTHADMDGTLRRHHRSAPPGRRRGVGRDFHFGAPKAEHRRAPRTALRSCA